MEGNFSILGKPAVCICFGSANTMCNDVAGSSVVNGGGTHQVLSPMAVTTFQVNPNNGQPTIIDPALISQYSGRCFFLLTKTITRIFVNDNIFSLTKTNTITSKRNTYSFMALFWF